MMTADQILSLLVKLNDTIDGQAQTIAALQARLEEKRNDEVNGGDIPLPRG